MPFKDRDKRQTYQRQYTQKYYQKNRDSIRVQTAKRKKDIKSWFAAYKRLQSCVQCSESHPSCLEFHHVDPNGLVDPTMRKYAAISTLVGSARGIKTIKRELEKCQVLCANCHRKHHWDDWGQSATSRMQHIRSDLKNLLTDIPDPKDLLVE